MLLALRGVPESHRGLGGRDVQRVLRLRQRRVRASRSAAIAAVSSYQGAFAVSAVLAAVAMVLLRRGFGRPRDGHGADGRRGRDRDGRADLVAVSGLLVTNDFPPKIGGIQSYLHELWRRLPVADATVLTTRHEGDTAWDAQQAFRVVRAPERQFLPTASAGAPHRRAGA